MATYGKLTVGKLKKFLAAFPEETPIVLGKSEQEITECHANTYYPPDREDEWPLLIIDEGEG